MCSQVIKDHYVAWLEPGHGSSCNVNQNLAQVDDAALTDAEQLRFTSSRVPAWHDTRPRGEVPPLAEGGAVANGSNDGSGDNWSDPWDLTYPRASGIRRRDPPQLAGNPENFANSNIFSR